MEYSLAFFMPSSVQISYYEFNFRGSLLHSLDKLPLKKLALQSPYHNHINANRLFFHMKLWYLYWWTHSPLDICIVKTYTLLSDWNQLPICDRYKAIEFSIHGQSKEMRFHTTNFQKYYFIMLSWNEQLHFPTFGFLKAFQFRDDEHFLSCRCNLVHF